MPVEGVSPAAGEVTASAIPATPSQARAKHPPQRRGRKGKGPGKDSKAKKRRRSYSSNEDEDLEYNPKVDGKKVPLPGQFSNCADCDVRFTVTPYTKAGDDENSLLCHKCANEKFGTGKPVVSNKRDRRIQTQSKKLDREKIRGAKSMVDYCLRIVAENIQDVSELGGLPPGIVDRLSMILSKHRSLDSDSLNLFLDPEYDAITIYDAGKLTVEDYMKMPGFVPHTRRLILRNAGQVKDPVLIYWAEKFKSIQALTLRSSNLVTNEGWQRFLTALAPKLESLDLQWCDQYFDGSCLDTMVEECRMLKHLTLKWMFLLDDEAILKLSELKAEVESLTLQLRQEIQSSTFVQLVEGIGSNLRKLVLKETHGADDDLLNTIHKTCSKLQVLKLTGNDHFSTAALTNLFTDWSNGPLTQINFRQIRDLQQEDLAHRPLGDELVNGEYPAFNAEPQPPPPKKPFVPTVGMADSAFRAMMQHSGARLEKLKLASCRHISKQACWDVFDVNSGASYPHLREVDFSFVDGVDNDVVALMMKSCPSLERLLVFGCFKITSGVALVMRSRRDVALVGCFALDTGRSMEV